jgi:glycerol kinase
MKRTLLLGIDIGTQSTRAALLTPDGVAVASASRPQELSTPQAGWAEQDPDQWWANVVACIRMILAQADASPDEIVAVGAGGQMHGAVPLAADGNLLSHQVQLWCDKRSAPADEAATPPSPTGLDSKSSGSANKNQNATAKAGNLSSPKIMSILSSPAKSPPIIRKPPAPF